MITQKGYYFLVTYQKDCGFHEEEDEEKSLFLITTPKSCQEPLLKPKLASSALPDYCIVYILFYFLPGAASIVVHQSSQPHTTEKNGLPNHDQFFRPPNFAK
jgi:hypothetical protein